MKPSAPGATELRSTGSVFSSRACCFLLNRRRHIRSITVCAVTVTVLLPKKPTNVPSAAICSSPCHALSDTTYSIPSACTATFSGENGRSFGIRLLSGRP